MSDQTRIAPAARRRPPLASDLQLEAVLTRWDSSLSVRLDAGARSGNHWLELLGDLQQPLQGRPGISIVIETAVGPESREGQSIGTLHGNESQWSTMLFVTEVEFTHLLTAVTGATTVTLSLGCSKPRYRKADIRYFFVSASGP
jgi:hypothetical protein